jgi:hypothetical protein
MMMRAGICVALASGFFLLPAYAVVTRPADAIINKELVGSWIVPPDSSDYADINSHMIETFWPNGTYTTYIYRDDRCGKPIRQIDSAWSVEKGVLISIYPNGTTSRDQVLSIGNGGMTLRSLDDGSTYTRRKSSSCEKPPS